MLILGGFDVFLELADTVILMKKMRERETRRVFPFPFCLGKAAWDVWFKGVCASFHGIVAQRCLQQHQDPNKQCL